MLNPPSSHLPVRVVLSPERAVQRAAGEDGAGQCDCACDCACATAAPSLRLSLPLTYSLELTPECNNRCPGCGNAFASGGAGRFPWAGPPPLDAAGWRTILDRIAPHARRLKVTGGEPLLHPEFEAILETIAGHELPFTLFTNGRWEEAERWIARLRGLPQCVGLLVSLHGANAAAHEAFSGVRGSFAEACATIRHAATAGLSVAVSTVITRHSAAQVASVVALAHALGARQVVFNRYIGRTLPALAVSEAELRRAVGAIEALCAAGHNVRYGPCIPACFAPSSSTGCSAGASFVTVDPWGYVRPCNHAPLRCGNLLEQPIEAIWNSPAMAWWDSLLLPQCRSCAGASRCHGGCRALALLLDGQRDPLIGTPLGDEPTTAVEELVLYEGARPVPRYTRREEPFGAVLVSGYRSQFVLPQHEPLLAALDGQTTLRQIAGRFGPQGLDFVGLLYREGIVGLEG